jgi:hypothetical protein
VHDDTLTSPFKMYRCGASESRWNRGRGLVEREKSGRRVADVCRDVLVRQSNLYLVWGMSKEDK